MIHLFPIGKVSIQILEDLEPPLFSIFSSPVKIRQGMNVPPGSFDSEYGQYSSTHILKQMSHLDLKTEPIDKVLGITDVDLFVPGMHFVFGEANLEEGIAVISLSRLRPEFYGHLSDDRLYKKRILKEAVHELGHTYQLVHCPDELCIMHFSNTIRDTDRKDWRFCGQCKNILSQKLNVAFPQERC